MHIHVHMYIRTLVGHMCALLWKAFTLSPMNEFTANTITQTTKCSYRVTKHSLQHLGATDDG